VPTRRFGLPVPDTDDGEDAEIIPFPNHPEEV